MPAEGHVILDGIPLLVQPGSYQWSSQSQLFLEASRAGTPVNLGPSSTWRQATFRGGAGRSKWDEAAPLTHEMYYLGNADTRFGYAQCRLAMKNTAGTLTDNSDKIIAVRGLGPNPGQGPRLYYASKGSGQLWRRATLNTQPQVIHTFSSPITAMGRSFNSGWYGLHIGLANGQVYHMSDGSETPVLQADISSTSPVTFFTSFWSKGDIAATANTLWKYQAGKWTRLGTFATPIYGGAVWNQRFWFIGNDGHNSSTLYVTDLVMSQDVFTWPSGFLGYSLVEHYGRLYILGFGFEEEYARQVGQIWVYDGASMRKLFEYPEELYENTSFTALRFSPATSYRHWLAFGFAHQGVWFYDPEQDAFHPGYMLDGVVDDNGNYITDIDTFGGRLVAGPYNETHIFFEVPIREYKRSVLISSEYDAGLPGVEKLWTRARVRFAEPLPAGASVKMWLTDQAISIDFDNAPNPPWRFLGEITSTDGREFELPIVGTLDFQDFRSATLRYRIELNPSPWDGVNSNATPKVEAVEIDYFLVNPPKQQWSFVAIGGDNLIRPDGQPYEYTAAELEAELRQLKNAPGVESVVFVDKDGAQYNVRIINMNQYSARVWEDNPDGATDLYAITVAEI